MSRSQGIELARSGDKAGAIAEFEQARDWINLSVMLAREGKYERAEAAALRCEDTLKACCQAMAVCWEAGWSDRAKAYIDQGLDIDPENVDLLTARGVYRLARGDQGGWDDAQNRKWANILREACDEIPEWDGKSSISGKRLAVLYEDGHGDRVMYSRFLRNLLEQKPERLVLYCSPETARLFFESFPEVDVISSWRHIGEVDLWIGLSSLGACRFAITGNRPYLTVPAERIREFSTYFEENDNLRVGLVWAGTAKHTQDHTRSKPFEFFEPLLDLDGIDFYSLQFDEHNLDHGGRLKDLSVYCRDTADTCAAIANLDLVIGVDTGMIHFAGALGVPAWVLCFTPIDWRWGLETTQSYWYDSVRIFRNTCVTRNFLDLVSRVERRPRRFAGVPRPAEVSEYETRYGRLKTFTHELWVGRSLEAYGEWAQNELDLLRSVLSKESVMVDGGANIGVFSVALSPHVKHVFAFEPQAAVFDILQENVQANGCKNVTMVEAGLGAGKEARFYGAVDFSRVCHPAGTALDKPDGLASTVLPLDSLGLKRLDFLKADVEGMELAVIQGAQQTIERCRPLLYLESNDVVDRRELIVFIDSLGYRIYQHETPLYRPANWRGNRLNIFGDWDTKMIFCVPRERFDLRGVTRLLPRVRIQGAASEAN